MALLDRADLTSALARVGELAAADRSIVELLLVGGGVMVLEFEARLSTRDLDVVLIGGAEAAALRGYVNVVANERNWPADWLNDAVKGFVSGPLTLTPLYEAPGIRVFRPEVAQLLAMKLCAWRDDVDVSDAARLLRELSKDREATWILVEPYLRPGSELKARYAFEDLWEARP